MRQAWDEFAQGLVIIISISVAISRAGGQD